MSEKTFHTEQAPLLKGMEAFYQRTRTDAFWNEEAKNGENTGGPYTNETPPVQSSRDPETEELLGELSALGVDVTQKNIQRATKQQLAELCGLLRRFFEQQPDDHTRKFKGLDGVEEQTGLVYYANPKKRFTSNYLQVWLTPHGTSVSVSILFSNHRATIYRNKLTYNKTTHSFDNVAIDPKRSATTADQQTAQSEATPETGTVQDQVKGEPLSQTTADRETAGNNITEHTVPDRGEIPAPEVTPTAIGEQTKDTEEEISDTRTIQQAGETESIVSEADATTESEIREDQTETPTKKEISAPAGSTSQTSGTTGENASGNSTNTTTGNPNDILYEKVPVHKYNSTGYSFSRRDGKPLTSAEVYAFIREQKKQGNQDFINTFTPHIKGKDAVGKSPTFEIKNSKYKYYGYSFDPEWGKKPEKKPVDSPIFKERNTTAIVRLKTAEGNPFKGIRLHTTPDPNDKDYINRQGNSAKIYEAGEKITIIGEQDDGKGGTWAKIRTSDGKTGWIEKHWLVTVDKDYGTGYTLHYVQAGENVEGILRNIPGLGRDIGKDNRAFSYVFWMMNKDNSGIYFDHEQYDKAVGFSMKNFADPWYTQLRAMYQSIRLKQGAVIRIPTKKAIDEAIMKGQVPSRPEMMNIAIKGARIIEGLLKGIPVGIYEQAKDTVTGLWDMIESIFTGEILDQLVALYDALNSMDWDTFSKMVLAMIGVDPDKFKEIWNGTNITVAKRYEYFGEIVGRIIFEVLMVIFVPGAVAGKALSKIPAVAKIVNTLKKAEKIIPDNVAGKLRKTEKVNEAVVPIVAQTERTFVRFNRAIIVGLERSKRKLNHIKAKSFGNVIYEGPIDLGPTIDRLIRGDIGTHIYRNDGVIFRNREGILSRKNNPNYYKEYFVPLEGYSGTSPLRIVIGESGEVFFTSDHYQNFIKLN